MSRKEVLEKVHALCVLEIQARDAKNILKQWSALVDFRYLEYAAGIVCIVILFGVSSNNLNNCCTIGLILYLKHVWDSIL